MTLWVCRVYSPSDARVGWRKDLHGRSIDQLVSLFDNAINLEFYISSKNVICALHVLMPQGVTGDWFFFHYDNWLTLRLVGRQLVGRRDPPARRLGHHNIYNERRPNNILEKITNSGHSDTYILVVLPFSNRPAATNHLDSGQFDWCFNLRTRRKWNLEDTYYKKNSSPIKCDVLQLLAANLSNPLLCCYVNICIISSGS